MISRKELKRKALKIKLVSPGTNWKDSMYNQLLDIDQVKEKQRLAILRAEKDTLIQRACDRRASFRQQIFHWLSEVFLQASKYFHELAKTQSEPMTYS